MELERLGTPIGDADMRIAAITLSRGLRMVTGNERHFRRVPELDTENLLEGWAVSGVPARTTAEVRGSNPLGSTLKTLFCR